MGSRAGRQDLRFGARVDVEQMVQANKERCAQSGGVNIHANVCVPARDRKRLERLARYAGRPPSRRDSSDARPARFVSRRPRRSRIAPHAETHSSCPYPPTARRARLVTISSFHLLTLPLMQIFFWENLILLTVLMTGVAGLLQILASHRQGFSRQARHTTT